MGTSKIKSVQANGTYQSKFDNSTMYTSEIELEDGTIGEVSAKSENRWSAGDEVEYTVTSGKFGNKLKLNKPNADFSGGSVARFQDRQDIILNEWSIGRALEWELSISPPDRVSLRSAIALAKKLKSYALDLDNVETNDVPALDK